MRNHVREMIHRARQGTDAGRARGIGEGLVGMETLAADAVRLARVAAAVHVVEATRSMTSRNRQEAGPEESQQDRQHRSLTVEAREVSVAARTVGGSTP